MCASVCGGGGQRPMTTVIASTPLSDGGRPHFWVFRIKGVGGTSNFWDYREGTKVCTSNFYGGGEFEVYLSKIY